MHEREAAEDALQEASLTAFLHLDQLQEPKAFPAWFRQIVMHTCHRMMRREHPHFPLTQDVVTQPDPHDEIEDEEQLLGLKHAVGVPFATEQSQVFTVAEAKAMVERGEIVDLKTAFGLTLVLS